MSDHPSRSKHPPDASAKPSAPSSKRSFFERQKAEAEAKRDRERAETEAVYEDFVKSFEDDSYPARHGSRIVGGGARRHFTNSSSPRKAGPGTLGPAPQSFSRKRPSFKDHHQHQGYAAALAFHESDDDEDYKTAGVKEAEKAAAKPTLYLATLPPGTSPAAIKSLIPSTLTVDNVRILPQSQAQASAERKSTSAIVTLANESAASDIDSVVSALQNKYLGYGYSLSISRHLSSAAIGSTMPVTVGLSSASSSHPFGAKNVQQNVARGMRGAPPPGPHRRGAFGPPSSYGYGRIGGPNTLQVEVQVPADLKQLKLIHKTLENLLNYGPEFEALLMGRPEVQQDEKWTWLWDPRSTGGVYYRWKLWDIVTNPHARVRKKKRRDPMFIFEGGAAWLAPETDIKFEYTTQLDEFVSDEDYDSSDEELSDREDDRRGQSKDIIGVQDGLGYMNPLQKAKLTHLLARLPTTIGRLRKGDIARVTAFALEHAGAGIDEAVDMIVSNIIHPFAYTGANPENTTGKREGLDDAADRSSAKLVGLYVVSDILSSSATSGVRHAWRYRQLFESALKSHRAFEHLGRLERDLHWGRLKAEKWKRSVGSLLSLWEGWCVFPQSGQEHFVEAFEKPPLTDKELQEEREKAEAASAVAKAKSRWRAAEDDGTEAKPTTVAQDDIGESMSDIDGVPMEDSDLEDADGEPMDDDEPVREQQEPEKPSSQEAKPLPPRKPRSRAADMFADSDSE